MGGKQYIPSSVNPSIPSDTHEYKPQSTQRYKRFCSVCGRQTYDWVCCGKRTRLVNLTPTIGDKVLLKEMETTK
jgi:hypothetical protein